MSKEVGEKVKSRKNLGSKLRREKKREEEEKRVLKRRREERGCKERKKGIEMKKR